MPSTIPLTCKSADGKPYRIHVPARSIDEAVAKAAAQGHELIDSPPSAPMPAADESAATDGMYAAAIACAAAGLLFPPASLAGIALGLLSRNGGAAIGLGLLGLVGWVIALFGFAGVIG